MAGRGRTVFRLFRIYARMDLQWLLRDTRYFLIQMGADAVSIAASVSGMLLLAARYQGLGGMDGHALLFMMGYSTLVYGLYLIFFGSNNAGQISRTIGRGQLDHCMLQPVPLWAQLITQGFAPFSGGMTFLTGIGMMAFATGGMELAVSWRWCLSLVFCVACSAAVLVCSIYLISCLAFFAPSAAEEISSEALFLFTSTWVYPLGGLAPLWQVLFCTALPVGVSAWLPSALLTESLPGKQTPAALLLMSVVAAALFLMTLLVFRKGLKHNAKDGCPRYVGFGHR